MRFDSNNRRSSVSSRCVISDTMVDSSVDGEMLVFVGGREFASPSNRGAIVPSTDTSTQTDNTGSVDRQK